MSSLVDYPMDQHKARLLAGDKKALAYEWMVNYCLNLEDQANGGYNEEDYGTFSISVDELVAIADSHQKDGWGDYISHGGAFEGFSLDPMFWDKYADLKGIDRGSVEEASFFSCSC